MGAIASQITSLAIVYSIVYSDADQRKHQSSASLAFVRGIHRGPENSPHKWPVTRKMFPFDDVIMNQWNAMSSAKRLAIPSIVPQSRPLEKELLIVINFECESRIPWSTKQSLLSPGEISRFSNSLEKVWFQTLYFTKNRRKKKDITFYPYCCAKWKKCIVSTPHFHP